MSDGTRGSDAPFRPPRVSVLTDADTNIHTIKSNKNKYFKDPDVTNLRELMNDFPSMFLFPFTSVL